MSDNRDPVLVTGYIGFWMFLIILVMLIAKGKYQVTLW